MKKEIKKLIKDYENDIKDTEINIKSLADELKDALLSKAGDTVIRMIKRDVLINETRRMTYIRIKYELLEILENDL